MSVLDDRAELDSLASLALRQEIDQRNWEEAHPTDNATNGSAPPELFRCEDPAEGLDTWEGEGGAVAPQARKPSRVTRFLENVGRAHAAQAEAYFANYVHDARERNEER